MSAMILLIVRLLMAMLLLAFLGLAFYSFLKHLYHYQKVISLLDGGQNSPETEDVCPPSEE